MMTIAELIGLLLQLTQTLTQATANIQTISGVIQTAQAAGRTTLTPEELAQVQAIDSNARQALLDAITKALAK
jgi:hypothetical protein